MSRITLIALGVVACAGVASTARAQSAYPAAVSAPCACGATMGHEAVVGSPSPVSNAASYNAASAPIYGGTPAIAPGSIVPGGPEAAQVGPIHPYSYYIDFPNPARTYVPYGPTDTFTYQGQAYGHAYDRWTWPAMSNASPGLGRYYQLLH